MTTIITIEIRFEQDVVMSRQRARQIAELLGFDTHDRTRIATAVSEIARNAFQYAKGGKIEFLLARESLSLEISKEQKKSSRSLHINNSFSESRRSVNSGSEFQLLWIYIHDRGAGIPHLKTILEGQYKSKTGMGLGIIGSQKLMDKFFIESSSDRGTSILMGKLLPKRARNLTPKMLGEITNCLVMKPHQSPLEEIQQQNQELIRTLEELQQRQEELVQLNRELEDTNRGVVALYAELDEKAEFLQRANELKTRFLSNMSHEFRTPLNSILSLSAMLMERLDGDLSIEQEKQVNFIRQSANELLELVNDLLDLAKVEAGKIVVHPSEFEVAELFATLRGMLRPLLIHNLSISLIFEEPIGIPTLFTDEGKVAQILRNFISNALKYTENGEVRVKAVRLGNMVAFSVADTGIGIAPEDRDRVFEEFIQLDSPIHKRVKGTGLGLPLSRKLIELLGGSIAVTSELGVGSTFWATIPLIYPGAIEQTSLPKIIPQVNTSLTTILVVEDRPETLFAYQKYFEKSKYQIVTARSIKEAKKVLENFHPQAVILDILLEEENSWYFLEEMKKNPATQNIPVLVVTIVDNQKKAFALGANAFFVKPVDRFSLLNKINILLRSPKTQKILIIDDEEVSRYLIKGIIAKYSFNILEADEGSTGIKLARIEQPDCIFLDLAIPDINGFEIIKQLEADETCANIPVIINTSKLLNDEEERYLSERTLVIIPKESLLEEKGKGMVKDALLKAGLVLTHL